MLVHEQIQVGTACTNVYLPRLHPITMLVAPVAPFIATNVNSATIIGSQPELNRVVFRDRDEPSHVNHEQVECAI